MNIGFVGLGHMGLPMARNLLNAGHNVTGYDVNPAPLEAFAQSGGRAANTLTELAGNQAILITMLQTGEQVKQVCLGDAGLFASADKRALFIDCSSIDVQASREIHQQASQYELAAVDAPVSGGVAGANAATLTFMLGGEEPSVARATPVLSTMGKTIIHTGPAGSGQAAKICNNMILGISMIAISEAFLLAEKLGLSSEKLHEVVTHASGQCWAMSHYVPVPGILEHVPANHDYEPGFTAAMMLKDLHLSQISAAACSFNTPMGHHAEQLYQRFIDQGMGPLDFSAIIQLLKQ